jgi:hypothetical protein
MLSTPHTDAEGLGRRVTAARALAATRFGAGPFTYTVEVTLDGRQYVGTAKWPTDEEPDIAPRVPLTWDPPLPSYVG